MTRASGAETLDRFLGGRLLLAQPARGHRVGTDAVLLASAMTPADGDVLFDLGAGVGAAGLAVAIRCPGLNLRLVEIEPAIAELARRNIAANGLDDRAMVVEADLARASRALAPGQADGVIMNPPFHEPGTVRSSPQAYRRTAHEAADGGDEIWIRRAASLLKPGGRLAVIHRAAALPSLFAALARRFGDVRVVPVLPRDGVPATRVILRAEAGSRAPAAILPPLILHQDDGAFTAFAAALHAGTAAIDWLDGEKTFRSRASSPAGQ